MARDTCTPVPMVMKFSWPFFLACLRDYADRQQAEEEAYRNAQSGLKRGSSRGMAGRTGGFERGGFA